MFLFLLTTFFIVYAIHSYILIKRKKWLPGPTYFPIVGSAVQFLSISAKNNMYDTIGTLCKRYGKLCGLFIGPNYYVFVEDPVLGKEILNSDELLSKFPLTSVTFLLYGPENLGISQAYGYVCKEMRKFSSRNLKRVGFGKQSHMNVTLQETIKDYLTEFETKRIENNGIINMDESFFLATLGILWNLMTGFTFTPDNVQLLKLIDQARHILKDDSVGSAIGHAFPVLRFVPGLTKFQEALDFWTNIRAYLQEMMDARRAAGTWKENPTNFMDFFLGEIEKGDDPLYTDKQAVQVCMDLFLAGLDSTANTLDWMLIYLISYPEAYAKVMQEIDSVIGRERAPDLQDRLNMPYTEAYMLEVMRIANVIIYTMRAPLRDAKFREYQIPGNTHIVVKLDCFHKSKEIWGDPDVFRPDRFLDENNKIINTDKIFTFGYGKRNCIGEGAAKQTIFIFFTTLIQKYKIEKSPKHSAPSLDPVRGILISHPEPFWILANPRDD